MAKLYYTDAGKKKKISPWTRSNWIELSLWICLGLWAITVLLYESKNIALCYSWLRGLLGNGQ